MAKVEVVVGLAKEAMMVVKVEANGVMEMQGDMVEMDLEEVLVGIMATGVKEVVYSENDDLQYKRNRIFHYNRATPTFPYT